jgi:hypothetical protein
LRCSLPATPSKMLAAHFPHYGKKPRLKRPLRIVSVSGPIHGHEHFLADVLELGAIYQMPAQKPRYQRAGFLK